MPVIKKNATGALKKKVDLSTVPSDALRTLAGEAAPQKNYASDAAIANSVQYNNPRPIASDAAIAASQKFSQPFPMEPGKTYASDEALANSVRYESPVPDADEIKGLSRYTTLSGISQPTRRAFERSADTDDYYDLMKETEANRPDAFQSRYEGAIQSILDGILNGNQKNFDLNKDANYQALYNLYAQQYQQQANRGMRDTMGAMQAATGGYGSTAAAAAAGQAYDRAMEGLNNQNLQLMQMAYQMYGDAQNDRYRQLGAVTGLDDTDYARYRDTVNDWMNDRNYYAGQYQNFYGNDWDRYQMDTSLDWQEYADAADRAYQADRDYKSDYNDAFERAYKLAAQGIDVPSSYAGPLEDDTVRTLNDLAAQARAQQAAALAAATSGGSGGGSGRRRSKGSKNGTGTTSAGGEKMTLDQFNQDVVETLRDNPNLSASKVASDLRKLYQDNGIEIVSGKYTEGNKASIGALRQAEYAVDTTKASEDRRKKTTQTTKKKK